SGRSEILLDEFLRQLHEVCTPHEIVQIGTPRPRIDVSWPSVRLDITQIDRTEVNRVSSTAGGIRNGGVEIRSGEHNHAAGRDDETDGMGVDRLLDFRNLTGIEIDGGSPRGKALGNPVAMVVNLRIVDDRFVKVERVECQ